MIKNRGTKPIICITTKELWQKALEAEEYTNSTIHSSLEEVGFIHCTSPDQTMDIISRFTDEKDVMLLFIDAGKVKPPVKFEPTASGRPGLFPHIYGPLNTDAIYKTVYAQKDSNGDFIAPPELKQLTRKNHEPNNKSSNIQ
jgi:uncharacterized protein (DUF952 family)